MQFCLFCGHQQNFLSQLGRNDERLTLTYLKSASLNLITVMDLSNLDTVCVVYPCSEIFLTVVSKNKVIMKTIKTLLTIL